MKILLYVLLVILATGFFGATAVRAQTVSPVPAPTIITTQPYTISSSGYYQLGADLSSSADSGNIITINVANVTLDLAGHFISGPANVANSTSQINGVYCAEHGNIIIRNGTIANCYRGINFDGNGQATSQNFNQRVDNVLVTHCFFEGIRLSYASNSVVSNCQISTTGNNTSAGNCLALYAFGGAGNQLLNNTVTNTVSASATAYGIDAATDTTITGNVVNTVTATTPANAAYGIFQGGLVDHNKVYSAQYGLYNPGKYADNLTLNCTTSFTGGTAVGSGNN